MVTPEAPNGIKMELFIFDTFPFTDPATFAALEIDREQEFAPVKNASGEGVSDSPATALVREAM